MFSSYKVILVGDSKVGKSSLVKRVKTNDYSDMHVPTMGCEVHPFIFDTSYGEVVLKVWDFAGQKELLGNMDECFVKADGCILMFSNNDEYSNVVKWDNRVKASLPFIPTIIVKNKSVIGEEETDFSNKLDYLHCSISVKNNINVKSPFLHIIRLLTEKPDLVILK